MIGYTNSPDPWAEDDPENGEYFQSQRLRYLDVPLVRRDGDQYTVVRGEIADLAHVIAKIEANLAVEANMHLQRPPGFTGDGIWGVLAGPFGLDVVPEGGERPNDYRWELRLDNTLGDLGDKPHGPELADKVESLRRLLDRAEQLGWLLTSTGIDAVRLVNPSYR